MLDWRSPFDRIRAVLFGTIPSRGVTPRAFGASLLNKLADGENGLRNLTDDELMEVVQYLLTNRSLRRPLQGSEPFLTSVASHYRKRRDITPKQRIGIFNVLERAYPHNLAAELRSKG